ncbi:MAG: hypothetical protein WKF87_18250 [Chryseolinea sp.]
MLKEQFIGKGEVAGFTFQQVYIDTAWCIYQVTSYGSRHYEVFKRRLFFTSGEEVYPKAKSFGDYSGVSDPVIPLMV